jgi:type II secretory pathway component GspD/PulD (secretin)
MSETPTMQPCGDCGHALSIHDTGWDAAGCMVNECSCRSYCEPKAAPVPAMSETPQEVLEKWLENADWSPMREAIRAVLDLVRVQYAANEEMTRLLRDAEAEVARLRALSEAEERVTNSYRYRLDRAEAALLQIDHETRSASDVTVLRLGSIARSALRDTAPAEEEKP